MHSFGWIRCRIMASLDCIILIQLWLVVSISLSEAANECIKFKDVEKCGCSRSDGEQIDLKPLIDNHAAPLFYATLVGGSTYSFDPCRDFTDKPRCVNVAACQTAANKQHYSLGVQSGAHYTGNKEPYNLTYDAVQFENYTRSAIVILNCTGDAQPTFSFSTEEKVTNTTSRYVFKLSGKQVCMSGVGGNGGLGPGSIMLIVFFVLLLVYVIAGVLYLKFVKGAQGVELIPNYEFWKELPSLVKDGVSFTLNGCKADSTYDRI